MADAVVVTGGSRGIGASIVEQCLAMGNAVCFTYTSDEQGAARVLGQHRDAPVLAVRADVADEHAMAEVFDRAATLGPVTALVNNAGMTGAISEFTDIDPDQVRRVIEVNLTGPILASRIAVPRWQQAGPPGPAGAGRSIINISSIAASYGAPGEYIPYAAAKAGIETFTRGLARELGPIGIRVNAVSPGTTLTDIHALAGEPERPARVAQRIPLRRPAEVVEISAAVAWLLSEESRYVTGAVIPVAGGL